MPLVNPLYGMDMGSQAVTGPGAAPNIARKSPTDQIGGAVNSHPMSGSGTNIMLAVYLLAAIGVLAALHAGGFRTTLAIGRA